jgi:hypothetical protein
VSRTDYKQRRGVAATEFAVCLPVLLVLLLGTVECCSMLFLQQSLSAAAYESGHAALAADATAADARATGDAILADRRVRGGNVTLAPANLASVREGEYFEVRVSAPTDGNRVLPLSFFAGRTLTATAVFMKEI